MKGEVEIWTLIVSGKRVGYRAEIVARGRRWYGPRALDPAAAHGALRSMLARST